MSFIAGLDWNFLEYFFLTEDGFRIAKGTLALLCVKI